MRRQGGRRRNAQTADLNITAFMNLMVILVPFLLITAVFSRLAILELNLPGPANEPADPDELLMQLEIIVRADRIEVGDRNAGVFGSYPAGEDGHDYAALSSKLGEIKDAYPDTTDATVLLESDIAYDTLVQVMDRVRVDIRDPGGTGGRRALFPDISIGDAPPVEGGA